VPTNAMEIANPTIKMSRPLISSLDSLARNFISNVLQGRLWWLLGLEIRLCGLQFGFWCVGS
jgi:hypothetical protein